MAIKDFLHPIWKSSLSKYSSNDNFKLINSLQKPIDDTKEDILKNRVQLYLKDSSSHWLDYWGTWIGLRRKKNQQDDDFRASLINHILHSRNTVYSIRKAIADFIKTNEDNIYIYEPFRDMFIWNSSYYNTLKYFPSSYYRYAIIDVHIDASFPPEVSEIINLFRPAGVIWVITDDINGVNPNSPILDFNIDNKNRITDDRDEFTGLFSRETYRIIASLNDNPIIGTPFIWNSSKWNNGDIYYRGNNKFDIVNSVGQTIQEYKPDINDDFSTVNAYINQRTIEDNINISTNNDRGVMFRLDNTKNNYINRTAKFSLNNTAVEELPFTSSISNSQYQIGFLCSKSLATSATIKVDLLSKSTSPKNIVTTSNVISSNKWLSFFLDLSKDATVYSGIKIYVMSDDSTQTVTLDKVVLRDYRNDLPVCYDISSNDTITPVTDISSVFDVKQFLMRFTSHATSSLSPIYIDNLFKAKNFVLTAKSPIINSSKGIIKIYDFTINMWVSIMNIDLSNIYKTYNFTLNSIVPYLNNNCLMYIRVFPQNGEDISVDYIGLTLSNIADNDDSILVSNQEVFEIQDN